MSSPGAMTAEQRQLLLVEWNSTDAEYPRDVYVHQLVEAQVLRSPDAVALAFGNTQLTYRELDQRANVLAGQLRHLGVTTNTLVGVYIERSVDLIVAVVGILKSGGAYVPLDPFFPRERLAFMVSDARLRVLVTHRQLVSELPDHQAQLVCLDELSDAPVEVSREPYLAPPRPANPGDALAYVMYTSGSTGRPKGVQVHHRAVVNFLISMQRSPGLRARDVWLAVTTLSFDISVLEIFLPLMTGAKVVVAPRDVTVDGLRLAQLLKDCGATVMQATPATWRMLIEAGWSGDQELRILCGGEAMDRKLADQLLARSRELWNMYGPTETTVWSTTERLLPGQPITIGRPIANTTAYILNESLQPVTVGVVGELFIGGDGVAAGYLNRLELTTERFIPSPFETNQARRLYRTGDLARFRTDGKIELLGRADQQIKVRGFRIELGEIESALAHLPDVGQAVVAAREDSVGDKRLVAYIVPKNSESQPVAAGTNDVERTASALNPAAVRTALRATLPEYMVPSAFVFLNSLPLTPNGKVDRESLPPPDHVGTEDDGAFEAPRGHTEVKLAGIMASLLRLPRVGRKDNFFDLGGHSILAVMLFNEIEREFGKRLPLATLFRAPTIEQLAPVLEEGKEPSTKWASLVAIQPKGSKPRLFCVHGAGGNVLLYRDLARQLGVDYPVYGLQSQGLDGKAPPLTTVEAMAEHYCREVLELQPVGPFYLAGYCLGGTVAYEMALRLRRAGHEVALVALLDTYNFTQVEQPKPIRHLRQKLMFHMNTLAHMRLSLWPGYVHNKLRVARDGEFSSLWKSLIGTAGKNSAPRHRSSIEFNVQELNDAAANAYQPRSFGGRVTVFKPKVNYDFYPDPLMGWGGVALGGVEVVELSANPHAMLVEPFVRELALELRRRLHTVGSTAGSPAIG